MRRSDEEYNETLERFREALEKPRTMRYLTNRFGVDRRTINRWMGALGEMGHTVSLMGMGRPQKYQIRS